MRKALGPDYDVDTHFTPRYNPWDQRLCLVPDGDLFEAIKAGRVASSPIRSRRSPRQGIALRSGEQLEADLIVTATGLNLQLLGGMQLSVDGRDVELGEDAELQGHDVQRRAEPRVARSATRTRRGR